MMISLYVAILAAIIYLVCDFAESARLAAVQELSRLAFAVALLAWLLK